MSYRSFNILWNISYRKHTELIFDNLDGKILDAPAILLLGVFDGHGPDGTMMSKRTSNMFQRILTHRTITYPIPSEYIVTISDRIQSGLSSKTESKSSGTTALIVIVYWDEEHETCRMQVINTGDCRALLNRDSMGIQLTRDHKPGSFQEKNRINALLKRYKGRTEAVHRTAKLELDRAKDWRICGLSVSRAYGDLEATPYLSHRPDYFNNYTLGSRDSFLMLGCDGIWDVFSTTDISDFVMEKMIPHPKTGRPVLADPSKSIATAICEEAIKRGSMDNVSCIIVFI
jgi:protein phosphatase 2C family protein 2/3